MFRGAFSRGRLLQGRRTAAVRPGAPGCFSSGTECGSIPAAQHAAVGRRGDRAVRRRLHLGRAAGKMRFFFHFMWICLQYEGMGRLTNEGKILYDKGEPCDRKISAVAGGAALQAGAGRRAVLWARKTRPRS